MKYFCIVSLLFFAGCQTVPHVPFLAPTPSNKTVDPVPAQPEILDPITAPEIISQSHIKPFFTILGIVLLICFLPFIWIKLQPWCSRLFKWYKATLKDCRQKQILEQQDALNKENMLDKDKE